MAYEIEVTAEFEHWYDSLTEEERDSITRSVDLLEAAGPTLGYPHTSAIAASKFSQMRELRVQHAGRPYRVLYAFDPRRMALLLCGGDKTGDNRWYEKFVALADRLYAEHLRNL